MAFLVRKINSRAQLQSMGNDNPIDEMYADIPTTEFRTKNGTISTWIINSLEELENAVLAIATTSSDISRMDFIIIDTNILDENELKYEKTYAGMDIPVPDLQDTHYDIVDVTLKKLSNCMNVYRMIFTSETDDEEKYIVRYSERQIKDLLLKAINDERIDETKASKKIKEVIQKLKAA